MNNNSINRNNIVILISKLKLSKTESMVASIVSSIASLIASIVSSIDSLIT